MAARTTPWANQIADAIVSTLSAISKKHDATNWLTSPKVVRRGPLIETLMTKRPCILVEVDNWTDSTQLGPQHLIEMFLSVHCVSDGDELAEVRLNDMAADVLKAITDDHSLGELVHDASVTSYTVQGEAAQRSGLGIATLQVAVTYEWAHGAP